MYYFRVFSISGGNNRLYGWGYGCFVGRDEGGEEDIEVRVFLVYGLDSIGGNGSYGGVGGTGFVFSGLY